jgi:hypothetical protein
MWSNLLKILPAHDLDFPQNYNQHGGNQYTKPREHHTLHNFRIYDNRYNLQFYEPPAKENGLYGELLQY